MNQPSNPKNRDPAERPTVWIVFFILIAGLIPMWPMEGFIFGVPTWAAFAVLMSIALSLFATYIIHRLWPENEKKGPKDYNEFD